MDMQLVNKTFDNLRKHNIDPYYVESVEDLKSKVKELLHEDETVSVGGSMSLFESGVIDMLREMDINFFDRYEDGLTKEEIHEVFRNSFFADAYITSTNALTADGELYNIDGNGNRVAAMIYGPKSVIVVAGINKLVNNMEEAIDRLRTVASPKNAQRLNRNTPCAKTGVCSDCLSPDRICSSYVTLRKQVVPNRIKVILVNENLGY